MALPSHRRAVVVAVVGTALVVLYAAWAAIQIFVLNPLAAAPGRTLGQIRADMAAAGESLAEVPAAVTLGIGVALAIALLIATITRPTATAGGTAAGYLGLLALGAPGYFAASFGAGMSLADTYGISGGDHSPWALPLFAVSIVAVAGILVILLNTSARRLTAPA